MHRPNGRREHASFEKLEEETGVAKNSGVLGTDEEQAGARQGAHSPT